MKFLLPFFALLPLVSAQVATTFEILEKTPPDASWGIEDTEKNTVAFDFDLKGGDPSLFVVQAFTCGPAGQPYGWSYNGCQGIAPPNCEVEVFNRGPVVSTTYCFDIQLSLNGVGLVAQKKFWYEVTADETGVSVLSTLVADADLTVETTATIDVTTTTEADTRTDPVESASTLITGPVKFGEYIPIEIGGKAGYQFDIVAVSVGAITSKLMGNPATAEISLPLSAYTAGSDLTIVVTVDWDANGFGNRRRGLTGSRNMVEEEGEATHGTAQYAVKVEVEPIDVDLIASGAQHAKMLSMTALVVGASTALLL